MSPGRTGGLRGQVSWGVASCFSYEECMLFSWRQNSICKGQKGEMRAPTPKNASFLFAVVFSYSWRKISTVCGTISHSKPPSTCTSICLFKIFQALVLVTDSQQLLEDKSWLSPRHRGVSGRRQRGRKKRWKKGTRRAAAGPQAPQIDSKIKTNSVALTYTNLHLFTGAALKHRPSPTLMISAIRMQRWALQPHRMNYLKVF